MRGGEGGARIPPQPPNADRVWPAVLPFAKRVTLAGEPATAQLGEEGLGIGAEGVSDVERAPGGELVGDQIGERSVGARLVDDLRPENRVEANPEPLAGEVEPDGVNPLEPVQTGARTNELERRGFAVREPDLGAFRRRDEAGEPEAAAEIEDAPSGIGAVGDEAGEGHGAGPEMSPVRRLGDRVFAEERVAVDEVVEARYSIVRDGYGAVMKIGARRGVAGDLRALHPGAHLTRRAPLRNGGVRRGAFPESRSWCRASPREVGVDYEGRVAIVTGASSGIGRQVALDMASRGVRTLAVARRGDRLETVLREMRARLADCEILVGDVADLATAKRAVGLARERWGRLDFLVNNAGISKRKHILTVTAADAEETVRINLLGPIYFILESLPLMVAQKQGYIVNVSSVAGKIGNPREAIYSASKFGLAGLSETLYYDLHRRGVHTVLVNPGPIATEIWEKLESPPAWNGKFYPPSDVSRAIFTCIEKKKHEVTVPRHMGFVAILKAILPGLVRAGTDRFDPDPGEAGAPLTRPRAVR